MNGQNQRMTLEEILCAQAELRKRPISGNLELLPLCNMQCDMCFVRLDHSEMVRKGRLRTADEWLSLGNEMKEAGVLFLQLTGGEPLIYPDFKKVYLGLKKMGMILTINTNGTLIDEEMAGFLNQNKPRRVNVTLYGGDEGTYQRLCHYSGGFEKAIHGIQLLKAHGIDVKMNISMVEENKNDWEKIVALSRELDVPLDINTYMYPATRERDKPYDYETRMKPEEAGELWLKIYREQVGEEAYRRFAEENLAKIVDVQPVENAGADRCRAGKSAFVVNWQGELRACIMMNQPSAPVFEMGFETAWQQIVEAVEQIRLSSKCGSCRLRQACAVCMASTLLETGDFKDAPDYLCQYTKCIVACQKKVL